jgi:hypothetical protein
MVGSKLNCTYFLHLSVFIKEYNNLFLFYCAQIWKGELIFLSFNYCPSLVLCHSSSDTCMVASYICEKASTSQICSNYMLLTRFLGPRLWYVPSTKDLSFCISKTRLDLMRLRSHIRDAIYLRITEIRVSSWAKFATGPLTSPTASSRSLNF